jgi:hypothetical protein
MIDLRNKLTGEIVAADTVISLLDSVGARVEWDLMSGEHVTVRKSKWAAINDEHVVEVVNKHWHTGSDTLPMDANDDELNNAINRATEEADRISAWMDAHDVDVT